MQNTQEANRLNRILGSYGLPPLGSPGIMEALGFCVRDHEHFQHLITACEPSQRSAMYAALKPHVGFELHPLDWYISRAGERAEREQLPVIDSDGKLRAFTRPEIRTVVEEAVNEAVSKQHLVLVCRKCTKEATFHGITKADAVHEARCAGWTYGLDHEGKGREVCPDCPAGRN